MRKLGIFVVLIAICFFASYANAGVASKNEMKLKNILKDFKRAHIHLSCIERTITVNMYAEIDKHWVAIESTQEATGNIPKNTLLNIAYISYNIWPHINKATFIFVDDTWLNTSKLTEEQIEWQKIFDNGDRRNFVDICIRKIEMEIDKLNETDRAVEY